MIYGILFYLFAFFIIVSAVSVISVKNPVHSILWLIFCFFNGTGLFLLLNAELLAMALIIVYVGAVAVLFLFVIMMININYAKAKSYSFKYVPLLIITVAVLALDLYIVINNLTQDTRLINQSISFNPNLLNAHEIGLVLYTDYVYPFQIAGIILLLAMIGAIALTQRVRKGVKKQDITSQIFRARKDSVQLIKIPSNNEVRK